MILYKNKRLGFRILAIGLLLVGIILVIKVNQDMQLDSQIASDQLIDAVMSNETEKVLELINKYKVDVNQAGSEGMYPLEATLILENLEMAELLLEKGADPDVVTQDGKTIKEQVMSDSSKMLKELFSKY